MLFMPTYVEAGRDRHKVDSDTCKEAEAAPHHAFQRRELMAAALSVDPTAPECLGFRP